MRVFSNFFFLVDFLAKSYKIMGESPEEPMYEISNAIREELLDGIFVKKKNIKDLMSLF